MTLGPALWIFAQFYGTIWRLELVFSEEDKLNIYALPGFRVKVTSASATWGYGSDQETVRDHLRVDEIYTVERTEVRDSSTEVYLQEVPDIAFNSVNFVDVDHQAEEADHQHPAWQRYNRREG